MVRRASQTHTKRRGDGLEAGCMWGVIFVWVVSILVGFALWVVVIWAIITVVSGLNGTCYSEFGDQIVCPQ